MHMHESVGTRTSSILYIYSLKKGVQTPTLCCERSFFFLSCIYIQLRNRDTDSDTETQRDRDRQTDRQTDGQAETKRQTDINTMD